MHAVAASACDGFLTREWRKASGELERGAEHNALIQDLLKYVRAGRLQNIHYLWNGCGTVVMHSNNI